MDVGYLIILTIVKGLRDQSRLNPARINWAAAIARRPMTLFTFCGPKNLGYHCK